MNTNENPVLTVFGVGLGAITAAVIAVLVLVESFGWNDFSDDQYVAISGAIAALWAVVVPLALAGRQIVYPPSTVQEIKEDLATAPAVDPQSAQALAK